MHNKRIAQLGQISDAVDVVGKVRPIFQTKTVSAGRNILSWQGRVILQRVLVLNIICFEIGVAVVVLAIFNMRFETEGHAT